MTAAFWTFAVSGDAHRVIAIMESFRVSFIPSVNDLRGQTIVRALNFTRREPHRALAVRAGTVYLDAVARDQVRARVREHAIFQENQISLDQHVTRFSQPKRRPNDLHGREVSEIQRTRDVLKLAVYYAQRVASLREIQLVDAFDRDVDHGKISDLQVGESFLELVDPRVLDTERLDAVQTNERVVSDQRYPSNPG